MNSKKAKHLLLFFKHVSLSLMILGGTFLLNENKWGLFFIVPGGVLYSIYNFLSGFEEPYQEPNWELVYPELGGEYPETLDFDIDSDDKNE